MSAAVVPLPSDLEKFLSVIWRPGDVREIRVPTPGRTDSGYFNDVAALIDAVSRYDGRDNVYITINPVDPALLARAANRIKQRARATTSDLHIVERRWLPIDIDPIRPSDISASDLERELALATAREVYQYLHGRGWPDPVTAMSGNGYWLLYPISLPNDEPSKALVEGVLKHLAERFSTPRVGIDTTVANASRIVALIGTLKVKGDPTAERPHRRSQLSFQPSELAPVSRAMLSELVPVTPPPSASGVVTIRGERMPAGWVRKLLDDAGITYREGQRNGRTWYRLEQCPFHPDDDRGGDCGVGEDAGGKGLGHCFHNRGTGAGWREFKSALGIEAKVIPLVSLVAAMAPTEPAARGMDAADLLALDLPPLRWIVPDLIPEGTAILAAPPKVGKSCLVYQIAVEASIGGNLLGRRVAPGSVLYLALEDGKRRGQDRLRAVLAGRTMPRGRLEVRWDAPPIGNGLEEEIGAWLEDHPDAVMVAIDTLGKARPPSDGRKGAYEVDVEHLRRLQALFRDRSVALVIVHHARKEASDDFLASVSGTYGITGSVDTIIVVRRKRQEVFGQIHVTGRDVADATHSVRFDGLLWQPAPDVVTEGTFERSEVYRLIESAGRPIFPKAIADQLGLERTAVQHMVQALVDRGAVVRTTGGYIVARIDVSDPPPPYIPLHSTHSMSETSEGGHYARVRAREDEPRSIVVPADPTGWISPCHFYRDHQDSHYQTPVGWRCRLCQEEGA